MSYALLDARANHDPDEAVVYTCAETIAEAQEDRKMFPDAVLAEVVVLDEERDLVDWKVIPWPKGRRE